MSKVQIENDYKGEKMKIRNGFVSNSSSSSFVILGLNGNSNAEIIKKMDIHNSEGADDYGDETDGFLTAYCPTYEDQVEEDGSEIKVLSDANYLGYVLEEKELNNKTLNQIKKEVKDRIKKDYDVEIQDQELGLETGDYEY